MSQLLRFPSAIKRDPAIEVWMHEHSDELGLIARSWFEVMRNCGDDVRELLHDGHPTACIGDAAFGYVNAFKAHVNVGFFRGAEITDPESLLEGTGKFMRHVKLKPQNDTNATALTKLIKTAYADMKGRLQLPKLNFHEEKFASTFIREDKRARYLTLLESERGRKKILSGFHHCRDLDPRFAKPIPPNQQSAPAIATILKSNGAPKNCYVMSEDPNIDGREMDLNLALA